MQTGHKILSRNNRDSWVIPPIQIFTNTPKDKSILQISTRAVNPKLQIDLWYNLSMKTVGEILKRARTEKNLEFEAIEKKTRIRKKFLDALEKNDWSLFHSQTYIKGFIRNYSNFLGLKPEEMVAVFRRQYTDVERTQVLPNHVEEPLNEPLFRITPQKAIVAFSFFFIFLFISYLFIQWRSFTGMPLLSVVSPKEGEVFTKNIVVVSGSTDKDAQLFINNQRVDISEDGSFKQEVSLKGGMNVLDIESQSKLGKRSKVSRTIQVESY